MTISARRPVPTSTYRVQFQPGFGFTEASRSSNPRHDPWQARVQGCVRIEPTCQALAAHHQLHAVAPRLPSANRAVLCAIYPQHADRWPPADAILVFGHGSLQRKIRVRRKFRRSRRRAHHSRSVETLRRKTRRKVASTIGHVEVFGNVSNRHFVRKTAQQILNTPPIGSLPSQSDGFDSRSPLQRQFPTLIPISRVSVTPPFVPETSST
jgi:hypothetical protein